MGVGFKIGGVGVFKAFLVVNVNSGETITIKKSDDATITQSIVASGSSVTFTIKKKGTYNITSSDGSTASQEITNTNTSTTVNCKWSSTIKVSANSGIDVTAKLGSYTVTGTTPASGTTNTVNLTVKKKGKYTVTSSDGASTTVEVSTNGSTVNADVIVLSYIAVTGNPGFTVTATLDNYSVSGTLNSKGAVTLSVRKLGTYTVTSADGASKTVKVAGDGGTYNVTVKWTTTVTITTNPGAVVTLTKNNDSNIVYKSGSANSSTGVATVAVLCKGTYRITTDNKATQGADGNNGTVACTASTASARYVKLNIPVSLAVGNYSSNVLTAYWTRPSSNWTGCNVRYLAGNTPPADRTSGTNLATGAGNEISLTTTKVNGYNTGTLIANTKVSFAIFSYITINNVSYWSTTSRTASGTTANYVGTTKTVTSTGNFTVPTGWRTVQAFVVGGGGGGSGTTNSPYYGGGGGGGGYTKTSSNINVTPGQVIACTIGAGGSGGAGNRTWGSAGGNTSFGSYVSASGGGAGNYNSSYSGMSGGNGGSGGGGCDGGYGNPGDGGSDGADGGSSTTTVGGVYGLGGTGQGTTTKAWGSSTGTLYAGGGGGGAYRTASGASGGEGGGGAGGSTGNGTAGTANTGGGGGGAGGNSSYSGGKGGSGIILIKCVA